MKKRIFAMMTAGALLLSGCGAGNTSPAASSGEPDGLRELTVVLDWYPNALHTFLYDAQEKGYFADEGLSVKIQPPSGTNDAMSMVAAGKADIGLYYQQDVIQARAAEYHPVPQGEKHYFAAGSGRKDGRLRGHGTVGSAGAQHYEERRRGRFGRQDGGRRV